MTRIVLQLAVGLVLGVLTIATAARFDRADFQTATVAATAASTIIAPRLWWTGLAAFWIGQSAGWSVVVDNVFNADPTGDVASALLFPYFASARSMLVGAVGGGVLWHLVDLRRKRMAANAVTQDHSTCSC